MLAAIDDGSVTDTYTSDALGVPRCTLARGGMP